jgi:hypothetical protein
MGEQPNKILFLIGGNAGHGKDTVADYLKEFTSLWSPTYSTAYAYGIKKIVHETYGTPWEILNGNKDVKESSYIQLGAHKTDVTVRRALQKIGQFHRQTFGPTCWAAATLTRCKQSSKRICIVTDARHPAEEIHWIGDEAASAGFTVVPVRVTRKSVAVNSDHPSESLIFKEPNDSFSFVIENDSTLDDLKKAAKQLACAAMILNKTGKRKLKKKDNGYVVRTATGLVPYEPQLTVEDATSLAKALNSDDAEIEVEVPCVVEPIVFDRLAGVACGN